MPKYQGMLGTPLYPMSNIPEPSTNLTNGAFAAHCYRAPPTGGAKPLDTSQQSNAIEMAPSYFAVLLYLVTALTLQHHALFYREHIDTVAYSTASIACFVHIRPLAILFFVFDGVTKWLCE